MTDPEQNLKILVSELKMARIIFFKIEKKRFRKGGDRDHCKYPA